jgi:hypothetical protein
VGVTVAVTRVTANTSTGTQDITTSDLGGLTPKAAIILASYAVTDGTAAANSLLSVGACTGASNEWSVVGNAKDGQATTDTHYEQLTTRVVNVNSPGTHTSLMEAEFSAWITNGIRINITNADAAYLLTVILFAGTDLSAHANTHDDLGDAVDTATDITAPGFEPDIVFAAIANDLFTNNTRLKSSFGIVHNDGAGGITQRSLTYFNQTGQATTQLGLTYRADSGIAGMAAPASIDWYGEFGSFDSSGFTVTSRNAGANQANLAYLALNFGGVVSSWVGTYTSPTATGNDSETGPGFTPQFVMLGLSLVEVAGTVYTDNRAGSNGIGVFDANDEYTTIQTGEDNVATSNEQSLSDDRAIVVPDDDGTLDIEATFVSMDANGWTVNYSNAPATAKLFFALAIEEETAAAASQIFLGKNHPSRNILLRM